MKETDFARYLTQFLAVYLPGQRGMKRNSQISYRDAFSLVLEYSRDYEKIPPDKLSISQIDRDFVLHFLGWLEEFRHCKAATRNQRLAAIHSFFSFLIVEAPQYIEQAQKVLAIPMKKTERPPLMYLPLDAVKGLLDQPDRKTVRGRRDAVLLSLLYDTGARVQELIDLKICDISLNDTVTVRLTGKGGKSRIVPVMKPTGELLKQYIENAGLNAPAHNANYLFTNRSNKPLTRAGVTDILKKHARSAQSGGVADISDEITPHWLRHSKAMHLLQAGVNLVYIRDLLGHADISTTEIYARADERMKRKALMEAYNSPTNEELPSWKKDIRAKGLSGKHIGRPPFGYRVDAADKTRWVVDEEAASVVRHIFDLTLAGKGPSQIARILENEQILTVKAYYARRDERPMPERSYRWAEQSVAEIIKHREYTGCVCNFKTHYKSYKIKKRVFNDDDELLIIPDAQEAIITEQQWDRVQELRKHKRRPARGGRHGLFSGVVFCADCGSKMYFSTCSTFPSGRDHYTCSLYRDGRGTCSAHYIREDVLKEAVQGCLRSVTACVRQDIEGFREEWMDSRLKALGQSAASVKCQLAKAEKRLDEIDVLLMRLYEDLTLGNLSRERYRKMTDSYETEQKRLREEADVLSGRNDQSDQALKNLNQFVSLVEKYVDIVELTSSIVNEFIKKILVYAPDNSSGKRRQKNTYHL